MNAINRIALMRVEWESIGLGPEKPREVWDITLSSGDPKEEGQLLYHQTFGDDEGKPIVHMAYLSCGVARDLAQNDNARQNPQDGIDLQRWQDLLQWGVNLGVHNADEVQSDDELKQCVSRIPGAATEDGVRALAEELLRWYGSAYTKGMEVVATNLLVMGLSSISVAMITDLDDRTICRLEDSLSA